MKNRRGVMLCVEKLESRLVPSAVSLWESTNWAGYAISPPPAGQVVSEVSGQWEVPMVRGTGTAYSVTWVGIDGFSSGSVEQIGTASNLVNGTPQYYAWWEMYPANSMQEISPTKFAVNPGDLITAIVTFDGTVGSGKSKADQFTLTITDRPASGGALETFSETSSLNGVVKLSSAEWIEEVPSTNRGVLTLANFGSVTFINAEAATTATGTTGGTLEGLGNYAAIDEIYMVNSRGTEIIAATSALAGNNFTVAYGSATPGAPSGSTNKAGTMEQLPDVQQVAPGLTVPAQALNVTVVPLSSAAPGGLSGFPADGMTLQGSVDALSSQAIAFFAGNTAVGGMNAPDNHLQEAGIRLDAWASSPESCVQWFWSSPGSSALALPAVVPPSEAEATALRLSVLPAETAAKPGPAGSKWTGYPGSTREQLPIYAPDVPIQPAASLVLLAAVLNGRWRTSANENETKARLRTI